MERQFLNNRLACCFLAFVFIFITSCSEQIRIQKKEKFNTVQNIPPGIERWEKTIEDFEENDQSEVPKKGSIVFVGSSSIAMWKNLKSDFSGKPVLNRGFGGSQADEVHYYAFKTIFPYKPKQVVIYVGDNDIASGKSPDIVFKNLKDLFEDIRYELPKTKITFISIKPSPSRWELMDKYSETNSKVKDFLTSFGNSSYVDIVTPMLMENGKPNPIYFSNDSLHMTSAGYDVWKKAIAPDLL